MCASSGKFKFTDYDCISFDLDNTLASYKIGNQVEMEHKIITDYLVKTKGYPSTLLSQPLDTNFILKGLILDSDNGNVIRITDDGTVFQACHGTKILTQQEIEDYYPEKHWSVADEFVADPLKEWNGPYASKFIALQDYYDIGVSLIFARAVDAIDSIGTNQRIKYHVWDDILESLHNMFDLDNFDANSNYYANMKKNPEKYYKKCSKRLLNWLKELRKHSKLLLITGSTFDFASHTASYTIGAEWKEYFDIVVCQARKPGFFTKTADFHDASGNAISELQFGSSVYTKGNWRDLQKLVENLIEAKPKCLYVGDHLIQDVYTPDLYTSCDVVCVCEELEAEGVKGYGKCHPDERYLVSSMWGSYFYPNNNSTIWKGVVEKHSKLCVPSMEYVSQFPVDYEYSVNSNV